MSLYVALCYYDRDQSWENVPDPEFTPEYTEFARRATEAGVKGGDVLVTDGPYAEAKEVLAGYFLLEAADLDEAIGWAAQIPAAWRGKIELRPVAPAHA